MLKRISILFSVLIFALLTTVSAQKQYRYDTVPNDPLHARIYTLDNGLKVFLTVYKDAPRIQTFISVKVGSKNDPKTTTGLAHYLEHLMFKGTPNFGTLNWEAEAPLLNKIEGLFETYRNETDDAVRAAIYHQIDSISYEASKFAIPNEYDKIMKFIGSQGTNAATSNDYTIYQENIPANQLENWAIVQSDRFLNPILRIFHTELETVYEEKNRSLTNDSRRANEAMMAALYPNNAYGQQTTLGSTEHLKNPSIKNIREFYNTYYIPNNMAVSLSGDFQFEEAIAIIDKYLGQLKRKNVPVYEIPAETPITSPVTTDVTGLEAEFVYVAFRMDMPANSKDIYLLNMLDKIMANGKAGLIDLNLNQQQTVFSAYSFPYTLCDNSAYVLYGKPKTGQTPEEVKDLLLKQIELLKKGEFDASLMQSAINNMRLTEMRQLESNTSRAMMLARAFQNNIPWSEAAVALNAYDKITKEDIVRFANQHLNNNYVVVYKRQGTPTDNPKVTKPPITPIVINREAESPFFTALKNNKTRTIQPVFVDFNKEIQFLKFNNIDLLYKSNVENKTFTFTMRFPAGELNEIYLPLATEYFDYLGTDTKDAAALQTAFYQLACNQSISADDEYTDITITGLSENFEQAFALTMDLLKKTKADPQSLQNLVLDELQQREDVKSNQNAVLKALRSYGEYGPDLCKYNLTEEQLKNVTPKTLIDVLQSLLKLQPQILYYGTEKPEIIMSIIKKYYTPMRSYQQPKPAKHFDMLAVTANKVLFAPYDAQQAQIVTYNRGNRFDKQMMPIVNMYNQYFG
ncbi:MAG: insulinase family protein, partial [Bacteroidales bacterium]|nr:insulinase family protein [Bacteroidales bacterium]